MKKVFTVDNGSISFCEGIILHEASVTHDVDSDAHKEKIDINFEFSDGEEGERKRVHMTFDSKNKASNYLYMLGHMRDFLMDAYRQAVGEEPEYKFELDEDLYYKEPAEPTNMTIDMNDFKPKEE